MKKNLHSVDDIFREAQENLNVAPPENGWEKVQATLDKQDKEKYRVGFLEWRRLAIILFLLLSGFIIYQSLNKKTENKNSEIVEADHNPSQLPEKQTSKKIVGKTKSIDFDQNNKDQKDRQQNIQENQPQTIASSSPFEVNKSDNSSNTPEDKNNNPQQISKSLEIASTGKKKNFLPGSFGKTNKDNIPSSDKKLKKSEASLQAMQLYDSKQPTSLRSAIYLVNREKVSLKTIEERIFLAQKISRSDSNLTAALNANIKKSNLESRKYSSGWNITPYYSQDLAFYKVDNDATSNSGFVNERDKILNREKQKEGYSVGINLRKHLSKHFSLSSGLNFSSRSIGIAPEKIYATSENGKFSYKYIVSSGYALLNPSFGAPLAIGDSIQSAEAQHNINNISVPLTVGYTMYKKKFEQAVCDKFYSDF